MKPAPEPSMRYELAEKYYRDSHGQHRVARKLTCEDGVLLAEEDYPGQSQKGWLYEIKQMIDETDHPSSKCRDCRYKVGDYTGDPGYMIYVLFKTRFRLKFFKLKIRLFQILKIPLRYKCKTPSGKKIIRVAGQGNREKPCCVPKGKAGE